MVAREITAFTSNTTKYIIFPRWMRWPSSLQATIFSNQSFCKCQLIFSIMTGYLLWFISKCMNLHTSALPWRHNERGGVSNHQHHDCLLNCSFKCRSKETSKLRVIGLCEGNSPVTGEFPTQRASNEENDVIIGLGEYVDTCVTRPS